MTTEEDEAEERHWRRKERIVLAACVVAILGILAMARVADMKVKDAISRLREIEAKNAVLQEENNACWKGFREELKKVIRFRCPDNKEAK